MNRDNNKSINLFKNSQRNIHNLLTKLPRSSKRNPVDELFRPKRIIPLEKKEEEKKRNERCTEGNVPSKSFSFINAVPQADPPA